MKIGDLVNFYSDFAPFREGYLSRNPGVIIAHNEGSVTATKSQGHRGSAYVLWANGEMTREHTTYLEAANGD